MNSQSYPLPTVGALIVAPNGEILLAQSHKWLNLFSFPGGKVEMGESCLEALAREVWEETHLKFTDPKFALQQECIYSEEFWQRKHFVMHDYIVKLHPECSKNDVILNDEAQAFQWIQPEQALALPLHKECRNLIAWYLNNCRSQCFGIIGIKKIKISCIIGVNPEERMREQTLFIDIKVQKNLSNCLSTNQLEDSVNYEILNQFCTQLAKNNRYLLVETLAHDVLKTCFSLFSISWAHVCVKKPAAISNTEYAYVEMEMGNKQGQSCAY